MLFFCCLKQMEKESKESEKEVEKEVDELLVRVEEGNKRRRINAEQELKIVNHERNDGSKEMVMEKEVDELLVRMEEGNKRRRINAEEKLKVVNREMNDESKEMVMVEDRENAKKNESDEEEEVVSERVQELDPKRVKGAYKVEVQTYRNAREPEDGYLKKLVEELVSQGSAVFSDDIVPFEMKDTNFLVSTKGGLGNAAAKWGLELEGVTLPSKNIMFNPLMGQMLGEVFSKMRIDSINSLNDWLVMSNDDHEGNKKASTSPGNMVVCFVPLKAGLPSPYYNRYNDEEFISEGKTVHYNDKFWRNQVDFKNIPGGKILCILDCAGFIPEFVLKENSIKDHREALKWFHDYGCGVGGSGPFFKCSFFGPYVHVLESFLTSPIVKVARIYGFWPLFLIKNFLLQQTRFGVNGMQFSSVNMNARTSIMLIGFWRMKHNNRKKLEFISVTGNGTLLTQYQEGV